MGVHDALDTALYSKLTTSGGTALWGSRVYAGQAPLTVSEPFVIYQHIAGGYTNVMVGDIIDTMFQVECVALNQADARTGANYLDAALHNQALTVSGYNHIATTTAGMVQLVDTEAGKQYWRRGYEVRIRISE